MIHHKTVVTCHKSVQLHSISVKRGVHTRVYFATTCTHARRQRILAMYYYCARVHNRLTSTSKIVNNLDNERCIVARYAL